MWFFDSVLDETVTTPTPVVQKKKDEQDGSFLIIDENMNAWDIPDTAVKLFDTDENPVIADTTEEISSEISFFSDPEPTNEVLTSVVSEESNMDTTLSFVAESDIVLDAEEVLESTEAPEVTQVIEDVKEEAAPVVDFSFAPESIASGHEKNDIYAPVREAIAQYDSILLAHTEIAESKDKEISDWNARVAEAKAAAKKALEERKAIETEMSQVRDMRSIFAAQLK